MRLLPGPPARTPLLTAAAACIVTSALLLPLRVWAAGWDAGPVVGCLATQGHAGLDVGFRAAYWPCSWVGTGLELGAAQNLSNLPGADYYRAGWRNVVTWRSLRYLHPYVAILIGAVRQPVGYEGDPNFGSEVAYGVNLGLHVGVAAEVGRFQAAVEYGGSAVGDGSEELRACVTCAIRPLPAPRVLPPYVARVSVQYFSRLVGAWGFGEWEWPGWDASVWFPSAGHASRGYEFGIFFTQERRPGQGLAFHTGVFYLGTDWRFRAADRPLLRPFSLSAGGRLLVWTEGEMVPVLPAPTVGLDADFQMGRIVISGGVKALATYSPAHGFISGWTGRAGVGVLF